MTKEADSLADGTQEAQSESSKSDSNQKGRSQSDTVSVEQFNQLQTQIENLRRSMQSDKDKAVKRIGERVDEIDTDLKTLLQSAARSGKSAGDVLEELREAEEREAREAMLEFARAFRSGQAPAINSQGSEKTAGVNVADVVRDFELDENDTTVRAFMAKSFSDPVAAYREAAKLTKSLQRQPSEADSPSLESRRVAAPGKQDELMREYQQASKGLYGQQLIKLKQRMREKGLDIH